MSGLEIEQRVGQKVQLLFDGLGSRRVARPARGNGELFAALSVGTELEAEEAVVRHLLEDDRPRPITKEDAGRAVVPVQLQGQDLRVT